MKKPSAFLWLAFAICLLIAGTGVADEKQDKQPEEEFSPGFYYTIQKGDTLWDLSKKFYDSEWVWPALWSQNEQIKNPHLIYPGKRIRLYQKTDALKRKEPLPGPVQQKPEEEVVTEKAPVEEAAPAPEPEPEPAPPEEVSPPPETVYYLMDEILRVGFLKKISEGGFFKKTSDSLKIGSIFKTEGMDDKAIISQGDTVYIKPDENVSLMIGSRYFVYKPIERIIDPVNGEYAGHQYRIAGIAEITATHDNSYAVADIIKSYVSINVGDRIMPLQKRSPKIPLTPEPPGLSGHVVTNEEHSILAAEQSIVFLNKGEKDGVQPGQRYNVFSRETKEVDGKTVQLPPVVFGKLLVLLVQENTATAIITSATQSVSPGTAFTSPAT